MSVDATDFKCIRALLARIGLEMAFVDAEAPSPALAVLLTELAGACAAAPREITAQIGLVQAWCRDPASLADPVAAATAWHLWMEDAVTSWERGFPLPAPPVSPPASPTGVAGSAPAAATPASAAAPAAVQRGLDVWSDPGNRQDLAVLPDGVDPELMRLFCAEAEDLLRDVEQGALVLERQPDDRETVARVFRAFHTLKGNAAVMKLVVLQGLAHEIESLLELARRGGARLDRGAIEVILAGADLFARFIAEAAHQVEGQDVGRTIALPVTSLIEAVHSALATSARPEAGAAAGPSRPAPDATDPLRPVAPAPMPLPASPPTSTIAPLPATIAPLAAAPLGASPPAPTAPPPQEVPQPASPVPDAPLPAPPAAAATGSVRVDTRKLDALIDLVGELVIAESMVAQGTARTAGDEQLTRSLTRLHGITADLQRTAMTLRMVPIRATFQKMTRLVRDASVQLGKRIRLVLEGEDTELDRTVVEEIGDPLVHMIRNAIDHGIESPEDRAALGKAPEGTVTLRASHRGGHVIVEISDDGRGLDPGRIRARAVARGLIPSDAALDEEAVLDLIFAPGFSTAEVVTDLSGRGVGMDVARRNVERIRGTIAIASTPGRGSTFTVAIPLTLAIIEGLLVRVGDQRYVIPTLAVRESFRPAAGAVTTVHGRGEVVTVRGRLVPVVRLARVFGVNGGVSDPAAGILVAVEAGSEVRCLLVDDLVGKQEVVIKSLGETFAGRAGFAGAAILGDGRVGLILDPTALVRRRQQAAETAA